MIYNFRDDQNQPLLLADEFEEADFTQFSMEVKNILEIAYNLSRKKDKSAEKKLTEWIEQFPNVPNLKNYLSVYYELMGHREKSFEYNKLIVKQHPDYLFGKLNLAAEYIFRKELEKVPQILGSSLSLKAMYPNRKIFHFTEYSNFNKTVLKYLVAKEQFDKALPIVANLEKLEKVIEADLDLNNEFFQKLKWVGSLKKNVKQIKESNKVKPIKREEPTLPQTEEAPKFHFLQVQWLYENSFKIDKNKIKELLLLERAPLVNDLCLVVYDSIRRYKYFWDKDYKNETHDFILHALLLLQELKDPESLPAVLEFLRQPEELQEYWLSDFLSENVWQVLYQIGQDQLPVLEAFLKEPLNHTFACTAVSTAISQVALHQPKRREEVLNVYRNLLNFYYENRNNPEILDPSTIGFVVGDVLEIKGEELYNEIQQLYDAQAVDTSINGEWDYVKVDLKNPEDRDVLRKLQSIYEIIDEMHRVELKWEKEAQMKDNDLKMERESLNRKRNLLESEVKKEKDMVHYTSALPNKKEEPKVGRNDPCPCVSGLKYKKCHGKYE